MWLHNPIKCIVAYEIAGTQQHCEILTNINAWQFNIYYKNIPTNDQNISTIDNTFWKAFSLLEWTTFGAPQNPEGFRTKGHAFLCQAGHEPRLRGGGDSFWRSVIWSDRGLLKDSSVSPRWCCSQVRDHNRIWKGDATKTYQGIEQRVKEWKWQCVMQ